jgi:hypothetical protein
MRQISPFSHAIDPAIVGLDWITVGLTVFATADLIKQDLHA